MNEKDLNNFYASDNSNQPFNPGTFDQEEKIHNFGKSFKDKAAENVDADIKNKEDVEVKKDEENIYDQPAPEEEIVGLKEEIEKKVEEKAGELKISKEKLMELAELDLESLDEEKLKSLALSRGSLDFLRNSLNNSINEFSKGEKPNTLYKESPSRFLEFIKKHKGKISLGQLALYLSAFGSPALKELAGDHATVDIYGEKVSLKDLQDNPELIKEIDRAHNLNSPVDIKAVYEPLESFEAGSGSVKFSFQTHDKIKDSEIDRFIYFDDILGPSDGINSMNKELADIGISLIGGKECSIDDFINKKSQIANIMSKNLGVPEEEIGKYLNEFIEPNVSVSDISVVKLEDFKINQNLKNPEDILLLQKKKTEVYEKYSVFDMNPENRLKAEKELEQWWKKNGDAGKSFDKALEEEKKNFDKLPETKLKRLKYQETETFENADKFKELALKSLDDAGYSILDLKKIAEKNPEKVIKIMSEVIGKNVDYDLLEYLSIDINNLINKLAGEEFQIKYFDKKEAEGIPSITLESGKGVCHDYGITLVAMKHILEEEGVPNLDKFVSFWTVSNKQSHLWNGFATIDSEGKLTISYADPTWNDFIGKKLNAVDDAHYYTSLKKIVDEQHQKALDKIKDWNDFVFQEKLKEILSQYDPRLHERDRKIEGNQKLRETEKDIESLQEERSKSVKEHLKLVRDKLKKIYAKKDVKSE